ncbi:complement C1q tumor necrosis factor-related protein 3-like [Mercenaria mercenaria]|uniref:complement C1q tumor necrosis factor-related protein 3-like n=1 Tax=Mercenaria mercenaria TaxID=6596 RepID=UPI00234E3D1B|nr:complement C1q tumor necrosis factor-related protein 3-like [Mercenaria mercenaria]
MEGFKIILFCFFLYEIAATTDPDTRKALDSLLHRVENVEEENLKLKREVDLLRHQQKNGHSVFRRQEERPAIGFTAFISSHLTSLGNQNTILFDKTKSNFGNGFDNVTGYFVAPESGVYVFFANIMSEVSSGLSYIETEIVKNGDQLAEMYSGAKDAFDSSSNMAVTSLKKGDHVWVRVHGSWSNNFSIHCCFSTFSGFLIGQDELTENIIG